ncbi:MAG: hypothetical protein GX022_05385 [Clostridiaceae bacterium]|nr:hypothetical protein [Clostridiaceae bacterium]
MPTTLVVVIVEIIFIIIDLIPQYKNKEWGSFFLSAALLLVALVFVFLFESKIQIPAPTDYIEKVYTFILGLEQK